MFGRMVFLGHSSGDIDFVQELYRRLTRDGVPCFLVDESLAAVDDIFLKLERALKRCTDIVYVLSPGFCNSEWAKRERTDSISNLQERPILLEACSHLDNFPHFLRNIHTPDVSTAELFEQNYPGICEALGGKVVPDTTAPERTSLPPVRPLPGRHRMPYRFLGDAFIGRVDALWQIHDALQQKGVGIVSGTAGLGKTQAAIQYAHRFGDGYPGGVYWVDSGRGLPTLITQVSEAADLKIDPRANEEAQLGQLWNELSKLPPSLLILDNFPDGTPLHPCLPVTGHIHTLVTTCRQDLTSLPNVRLNLLLGEAGAALLNSGARRLNRDEAAAVVQEVGGLPLALELTKSYLNYRPDAAVPRLSAGGGDETDIARTFQTSWAVAPEGGQNVLRVMADLAPSVVPRVLIRQTLGLPRPVGPDDPLEESLTELVRLSLVELDLHGNPLVHRLIHAFVRYRNGEDRVSFFDKTATVIRDLMEATFNNPGARQLHQFDLLVPHAEALLASERLPATEAIDILGRLGSHQQDMGRLSMARKFSAAALERAEKSFEPGQPAISARQSSLALVLLNLGQLEEARRLLGKALASDEKSFTPGHRTIAIRQSNLAMVLHDMGRLEEARDLLNSALASDEMNFAPGHASIARSQSNLAMVLQDMGQLEEARDLLKKALTSLETTYGPGLPLTVTVQRNLAAVQRNLNATKSP
jgi:tetratricopeptide (TPR) repeat protein